jgi:FKBP-type peptidyl-prolyl cis-trans isomerase FkpA
MKKIAFVLLAGLIVFASCMKTSNNYCTNVSPSDEADDIRAFCMTNGISYQVDDTTGIFYQITNTGNSVRATNGYDTITMAVITKLLNGTQLQQNDSVVTFANSVPALLMFGVNKIGEGGQIKMVSPSTYAYGCNGAKDNSGNQIVPANAPLYYEIKLSSIKKYK